MNLSAFTEPVRLLLGDLDSRVPRYSQAVVVAAVRTALAIHPGRYVVTEDGQGVTPEPDANGYALLALRTGLLLVAGEPESQSLRTRAVSLATGSRRGLLMELKANLRRLEQGAMFRSWVDWHSFVAGAKGLPLPDTLTRVKVEAPWREVTISGDGIQSDTGRPHDWEEESMRATDTKLKEWVAAEAYQVIRATLNETTGVAVSAQVLWPDGSDGVMTVLETDDRWQTPNSYEITHAVTGRRVVQPPIVRDAVHGVVTEKPALVVL